MKPVLKTQPAGAEIILHPAIIGNPFLVDFVEKKTGLTAIPAGAIVILVRGKANG